MNAPVLDAWQDDDVGFVLSERTNDDAWISAEATLDVAEMI